MEVKEIFWRWINRILLPKFHNSITKIVVLTGLGLFGKSFIVWLIEIFIEIQFQTDFTSDDGWFGIILVFLGLTYNLISEGRIMKIDSVARKRILDHDRKVFKKFEGLIDEDFVVRILRVVGGSCRLKFRDEDKLDEFLLDANKIKYQFKTQSIETSKRSLIEDVNTLKCFINDNFDAPNNSADYSRLCKPEANPFINYQNYDGPNYLDLVKIFNELLVKTSNSYSNFRSEIKKILDV